MSASPSLTATCLCSSIHILLSGPSTITYLCHCLDCRKATGSLFSFQIKYPRTSVNVIRGSEILAKNRYGTDPKPEDENEVWPSQAWCEGCGCPVWCDTGDEIIVRGGLIDAETEEARAVLEGVVAGAADDDGRDGPAEDVEESKRSEGVPKVGEKFRPKYEFFCKRKPGWAKHWDIQGAQQRQELSQ